MVVVCSALWIIAVVIYGAKQHSWQSEQDVITTFNNRLAANLSECGSPCADMNVSIDNITATISKLTIALDSRIEKVQQQLSTMQEKIKATPAASREDARPDKLKELEKLAASANTRFENARKRYESGQGDELTNGLALSEAKRIFQSARSHYATEFSAWEKRTERQSLSAGSEVKARWQDDPIVLAKGKQSLFSSPELEVVSMQWNIDRLKNTRDSIASADYLNEMPKAIEKATRDRAKDIGFIVGMAVLPIIFLILAIETIAWVLRGFLRPS